ncbi:hypothetical protein GCM10029964_034780 [Kibdelosporangium lantanae]
MQFAGESAVPAQKAHEPGRPDRHAPSVVAAAHRVDSPDRTVLRTPEAEQPAARPEVPAAPVRRAVAGPDITELRTFRC